MMVSLLAMIALIFLFFFAKNLQMILAAEILCGIPWGSTSKKNHHSQRLAKIPAVFQTLTTSYASEVAPVALRGYLTTWVSVRSGTTNAAR